MDDQHVEPDSSVNIPSPKNSPQRRLMNLANIAICEFLEISIHNVLYSRKVYPKEAFGRRQWGNILIWRMLHPSVNEYIGKFMAVVRKLVDVDAVLTVCLSINGSRGEVLEEFMFHLQQLEYEDKELCAKDILNLKTVLQELLATLCSKSAVTDSKDDDCTFQLQTHIKKVLASDDGVRKELTDKNFPWTIYSSYHEICPKLTSEKTIESSLCKVQFFMKKKDDGAN